MVEIENKHLAILIAAVVFVVAVVSVFYLYFALYSNWSCAQTSSGSLTISCAANAGGGVTPYTYYWTFGDGATSTAANPTHTYAAYGAYAITIKITDASGAVYSSAVTLYVCDSSGNCGTKTTSTASTPLAASISASQTMVPAAQYVSFTSSVSGGVTPYSYAWSFGDGGTSSLANPSYAYLNAGAYNANLKVTDNSGTVVSSNTISITVTSTTSSSSTSTTSCTSQIGTITVGSGSGFITINGSTYYSGSSFSAECGASYTVTAYPPSGYAFSAWGVSGNALLSSISTNPTTLHVGTTAGTSFSISVGFTGLTSSTTTSATSTSQQSTSRTTIQTQIETVPPSIHELPPPAYWPPGLQRGWAATNMSVNAKQFVPTFSISQGLTASNVTASNGIRYIAYGPTTLQITFESSGPVTLSLHLSQQPTSVWADGQLIESWNYTNGVLTITADPTAITAFFGQCSNCNSLQSGFNTADAILIVIIAVVVAAVVVVKRR